MPSEIDFSSAIDKGLANADVQAVFRDSARNIDEQFVRNRLNLRLGEIESRLGKAIEEEREIEAREAVAIASVEQLQKLFLVERSLFLGAVIAPPVMLLLLWLLGFLPNSFSQDVFQTTYFSAEQGAILGVVGIMLTAATRLRLFRKRSRELQTRVDRTLAAEREALLRRRSVQIEQLVSEYIFETIGEADAPFFQMVLVTTAAQYAATDGERVSSARGLSEVTEKVHEVPTLARRELVQLLETLPGANIGLSGPRGAGKSTLMKSLAGANLRLGDQEAIAIYTAAPVEYDSREFLLHLFATLCRQVLRTHGVSEAETIAALEDNDPASALRGPAMESVRRLLLLFGVVASVMALSIRTLLSFADLPERSGTLSSELKPGTFLLFGLFALCLWAALSIGRLIENSRFLSSIVSIYGLTLGTGVKHRDPDEPFLVAQSKRHLADIIFQRSFTMGWSGSIKVPAGLDLGMNRTTSLARRQESFPELVDRFSIYVRQVAEEHGAVLIAIDELDKMKSIDDARSFIDEMKSIFNIPRCFYIVSVSEDALTSFERRGLALRDAFDSAFDDIRYVGHMNLEGSRQVLLRRILNLPDPFLCLCHVCSGGLPRDLIRTARGVFEAASRIGPRASLVDVAASLVAHEATTKLRAAISATRSLTVEPETSRFVTQVSELQDMDITSSEFRTKAKALVQPPGEAADRDGLSQLHAMQREIAAYLEFLQHVTALSAQISTQHGWHQARAGGKVDRLARIRRSLEFNIGAASARLASLTE